jgi:UDP-N-acetylmuramoyl-tripeptide--D-alanyl-D-alanine ligase
VSPLWTLDEVAAAAGGRIAGDAGLAIGGVSIDTRTIAPGDLFVALAGVRDGHDFVADAFARGASAALVRAGRVPAAAGALVEVDDTLAALEAIGRRARARVSARVLAVTGSVGKTTVKEALRHVLAAKGATHASAASYNNHFGVPLTLARMPPGTRFGVFEIGMSNPFEITPLSRMTRPQIACVTTVEPVHLENFRAVTGIADAKGEIFAGLEPGGVALVPRDNPHYARLAAHAAASPAGRVVSFGRHEGADVRLRDERLGERSGEAVAMIDGRAVRISIAAPGAHMLHNGLIVLAMAHLAGADLEAAAQALASFGPAAGRGSMLRLHVRGGEALLLDESYNANPASMRAAIENLGRLSTGPGGRRIAVLGDMLELGPEAARLHAETAKTLIANGVDLLFACGPLTEETYKAAPAAMRAAHAESSATLEPRVIEAVRPGDAIMVKGSNGSRMGRIVQALSQLYPVRDDGADL